MLLGRLVRPEGEPAFRAPLELRWGSPLELLRGSGLEQLWAVWVEPPLEVAEGTWWASSLGLCPGKGGLQAVFHRVSIC
jgi:hypothetical protein